MKPNMSAKLGIVLYDILQKESDEQHILSMPVLQTMLEERGIEVVSAKLERIPNAPQEFSEDQMADIQKMLDKMEDDEDIQEIYTNMA